MRLYRGSIGVLFVLLLCGCGINKNEVVYPDEILYPDMESSDISNGSNGNVNATQNVQDGIFLLTVDNDLFFLNHQLNQYKLSDQVDYFDYNEEQNIVKVKKSDGRWIIWFLENKKPELIGEAESIAIAHNGNAIYYSGVSNQNIYRVDEDQDIKIFDGQLKKFDVSEDGKVTALLDEFDTFRLVSDMGKPLYQKDNVISYSLDNDSQTVMIWSDTQVDILKLYEDQVTTYKVFKDITDWLMIPIYSPNFETIATLSDFDFETGVGNLVLQTTHANQQIEIQNVASYSLVDQGKYLYYLNDRNELYALNLQNQVTNFLGSGVLQYNIAKDTGHIVYKSEDVLYVVDSNHIVNMIDEDVFQYQHTQDYFAYTNSINDLFVYHNGITTKVAENIESFGLGRHGVYYYQNDKIIFKTFEGGKETIIDNTTYYKTIFYQNTELYQMKLSQDALHGYWVLQTEDEIVAYYFNENSRIEVIKWDGESLRSSIGEFGVMMANGSMLNIQVTFSNGMESYMTISLVDSDTIQISENENVYEVDRMSEGKALELISHLNENPQPE